MMALYSIKLLIGHIASQSLHSAPSSKRNAAYHTAASCLSSLACTPRLVTQLMPRPWTRCYRAVTISASRDNECARYQNPWPLDVLSDYRVATISRLLSSSLPCLEPRNGVRPPCPFIRAFGHRSPYAACTGMLMALPTILWASRIVTGLLQCLHNSSSQDSWTMVCLDHEPAYAHSHHSAEASSSPLPRSPSTIWTFRANCTK